MLMRKIQPKMNFIQRHTKRYVIHLGKKVLWVKLVTFNFGVGWMSDFCQDSREHMLIVASSFVYMCKQNIIIINVFFLS